MNIVGFAWGTPLRKTLTLVAAIASAIAAVPPAWSELGLPEAASKTWVAETLRPLRTAQNTNAIILKNIQLDIAEGKRSQVDDALAKWNLELGRATKPESQNLIRGQIRELDNTRGQLSDQIKTLRDMK